MTLLHLIILLYCSFKLVLVGGTDIEVGNTIDLFRNYGLLMRIFPSDMEHQDFMSNEFSNNIFDAVMSKRVQPTADQPAEGTWKMNVCENVLQVLKEILSDYRIEYVDNISNSFSTYWPLKVLAEFIGLHHAFISNTAYSFLLVQHKKCVTRFNLNEVARVSPVLDAKFVEAAERVVVGDYRSVLNLTTEFGTHYVRSFSAGSLIYQVIAFPSKHMKCFSSVPTKFTFAELEKCTNGSRIHVGRIKTLSDLKIMETRLNPTRYKNKTFEVTTIYSMKKKFPDLCEPDNLAITGFDLSTISDLIRDRSKSTFVREVINNQMILRGLIL